MGSWNETCALSHLPILAGDGCVKLLCYSGYETCLTPISLPVSGEYDDYGEIEGDWMNHPQWKVFADYFWPIAKENWRRHTLEKYRKDVQGIWRQAKGREVVRIAEEEGIDVSTFEGKLQWVSKRAKVYAEWVREGTLTGISPKSWEVEPNWDFLKGELGLLSTEVREYKYKYRYYYVLIRRAIWDEAISLGKKICEDFAKDPHYREGKKSIWDCIFEDPDLSMAVGDFPMHYLDKTLPSKYAESKFGLPEGSDLKSPEILKTIIDKLPSKEFGFHLDQMKSPVLHSYHEIMGPVQLQTEMIKRLVAYPLAEGKEPEPGINEGFRELYYLKTFLKRTRQSMHPLECGSQEDLTSARVKFHQAIGREIKKIRRER